MSKALTRTYSLRKRVRPIIDTDEQDDDQRRDLSGRKRVDVVECLLDSSSDEFDEINIDIEKPHNILWLTFNEICHIRSVIVQINLKLDKQYSQISKDQIQESTTQTKTVCYDCLQIFNEHSQYRTKLPSLPVSPLRRILSLPPMSSNVSNENGHSNYRHYRHRRPLQITNCKIEKTIITTTSIVTEL